MGVSSLVVGFALLAAPEPESIVRPTLPPADDVVERPRLRAYDLSFLRSSTLSILGRGRFGTWSLFGSTLGATPGSQACRDALELHCAPLALAELGIAWRPHGSRVSLFAAVGVASLGAMQQSLEAMQQNLGVQLVGGLRIDLQRWLGGHASKPRR